jgi:hypothetical protein
MEGPGKEIDGDAFRTVGFQARKSWLICEGKSPAPKIAGGPY